MGNIYEQFSWIGAKITILNQLNWRLYPFFLMMEQGPFILFT